MKKKKTKKTSTKKVTTKKSVKKVAKKPVKKVVKKSTKKIKKRKLKLGRVFLVFFAIFLIFYIITHVFTFKIKNLYIKGNIMLSDQEIIELAKLEDYPSYFKYTNGQIRRNIEKNTYILSCKVKKSRLKEITIEVIENRPLFYDSSKEKTILYDLKEVDEYYEVPTLLNYIPNTIYSKFIDNLKKIEKDIYLKISEIKYDPNDVDDKRFLFYMNDGNKVYVTLKEMNKINEYVDIMTEILVKYKEDRGTLYLDEGEYFEVFQN